MTSFSSEKVFVVGVPEPPKSIVIEYVRVSSICMVAVPCRRTASARARSRYPANCLAEFESRNDFLAEVIPRTAAEVTTLTMATTIRS